MIKAPKYPNIHVDVTGLDGNMMFILSRVNGALIRAGVSGEEHDKFLDEAVAGDYDHFLSVVAALVDVDLDTLTDYENYKPQ